MTFITLEKVQCLEKILPIVFTVNEILPTGPKRVCCGTEKFSRKYTDGVPKDLKRMLNIIMLLKRSLKMNVKKKENGREEISLEI